MGPQGLWPEPRSHFSPPETTVYHRIPPAVGYGRGTSGFQGHKDEVPRKGFFFGRFSGKLFVLLCSEIPILLCSLAFWPEANHDIKPGYSCQALVLSYFFVSELVLPGTPKWWAYSSQHSVFLFHQLYYNPVIFKKIF